jgi:hypothetical protein
MLRSLVGAPITASVDLEALQEYILESDELGWAGFLLSAVDTPEEEEEPREWIASMMPRLASLGFDVVTAMGEYSFIADVLGFPDELRGRLDMPLNEFGLFATRAELDRFWGQYAALAAEPDAGLEVPDVGVLCEVWFDTGCGELRRLRSPG